ncbi:MAG TPA: NAD(P)H-hydrate dehydratase [Candidatus Omnitrophota bacterium]|nr:NAD(P)H-hydrate dehydratase [Candidatus Omnitrophota bacterium]HPD85256.1 NAD(P)H-hydrate dehydratase [Candidatus Omnitrophota bacterium]HRZ04243.1 NAD(P)H-hydrate dehydratase [Candidatus Omnitrophota bacterium]
MRLPAPLLRRNKNAQKYDFGHVLILAGSENMMGAAALTALAAMRSGAGLTTLGIPKKLNAVAQKKLSPVVMTWPLAQTAQGTLANAAFTQINKKLSAFDALALGPGLSRHKQTQNLILRIIGLAPGPLVADADALYAIAQRPSVLLKSKAEKILTPHVGEMARLTGLKKDFIEKNRKAVAAKFAKKYNCVLLLKGRQTIVASPEGKIYVNATGNAGMATAGSGDVLTGMLAAFLGQGLMAFEASKLASYIHGKAGDLAAKEKGKAGLIATDIIERIPDALRRLGAK